MGLDEAIAKLQSKVAVTPVTDVTANTYKLVARNSYLLDGVTDVTDVPMQKNHVTSDGVCRNTDVTEKSLYNKEVTVVTDVTDTYALTATNQDRIPTHCWWIATHANGTDQKFRVGNGWIWQEWKESHPEFIRIEPDIEKPIPPAVDLASDEEHLICAWLALIEETDPLLIQQTIEQCRQDQKAREYFLGRAIAELPKPDPLDDRRPCTLCANFVQDRCRARHVWYCPDTKTLAQRCKDYHPLPWDLDQRPGSQRWSL